MVTSFFIYSPFIRTKQYLLGDEPCQADAGVFGQLSQIYGHSLGNEGYTYLKSKHVVYIILFYLLAKWTMQLPMQSVS